MSAIRRDIGPALQRLRAFLCGREHTIALRFEDGLADRTQPPPDIPGGPAHIISANYYANRDPRREVDHPIDVGRKVIGSGAEDATESAPGKLPTPGIPYTY